MNAEKITFEDIIVDGNRAENAYIDGCRGGAIYLYEVRDAIIRNCTARNYNGDGISFQITDNVQVLTIPMAMPGTEFTPARAARGRW